MDWDARTIRTYDESAKDLAKYFRGIGPRTKDIERGLQLCSVSDNISALEIGCGDGRDAEDILSRNIV